VDENGIGHFYGHHIKSSDISEEILKRLGYDNEFIEDVKILIRYHYIKDIKRINSDEEIKRFIDNVGKNRLEDMFDLVIADAKGKADWQNFQFIDSLSEKCCNYIKLKAD